jgi:hypothetical protein
MQSTFSPVHTFQPVHPVAVAPTKTTPDIGKFRLPVEYKLKNIPAESLKDFLAEQFDQVEAEATEETGAIMITASLIDHRVITNVLIELEREIAALRSKAANIAEAAEVRVFAVEHYRPTDLVTEQLPVFP